jgi:flagellar assembly protein FliH
MSNRYALAEPRMPAGFVPRWSEEPARFAPWQALPSAGNEDHAPLADEGSQWDAGYAAGHAEGQAAARADRDHTARLVEALERLAPMPPAEFAEALSVQVRELLRELVGSAGIDEDLLRTRCAVLAEMAEAAATPELHLHPEDAALLADAAPAIPIITSATMARGEVRLVDGPSEFSIGPHTALESWEADQ